MHRKVYVSLFFLSLVLLTSSRTKPFASSEDIQQDQWVDSLYNSMTLEQKIGQLFMVAAYSNKDAKHEDEIAELITKFQIGGLIFMQGGPQRQIRLTNRYQQMSNVPLLIAMDAEWGLNMRLKDSTLRFPRQMTLGAIQNNDLITEMGVSMAEECQRIGVHVNFAPVVDVNVNPNNPVIGTRSFGENKENVAQKGMAISNGLQSKRVMAVAKHFPGHGDTDKDSHLALPIIPHSIKRLNEVELHPFRSVFKAGIKGVMVAHLHIPALDARKNRATTLSKNVVSELLINEMKFDGLIFTDALGMKGVSDFNKPGEVDLEALKAGNDVLLFPENVPFAIQKIRKAYNKGKISEERLAQSVKKMLAAKYWAGIEKYTPISSKNVHTDLNSEARKQLIEKLYANAITLVRNEESILPINKNKYKKIACVNVQLDGRFGELCKQYDKVDVFNISNLNDVQAVSDLMKRQMEYDLVIVGVGTMNNSRGRNYGLNGQVMNFLNRMNKRKNVVLCVFGNPYSLKNFESFKNVVCAYKENEYTVKHVPNVLFGIRKVDGKLPVTASDGYPAGAGITIKAQGRMGYAQPDLEGFNLDTLMLLDKIANEAIAMEATPGCQILVARNGNVIYNKSFGYYTYDSTQKVTINTLYDVASVTKISATLQAVMKLHAEGKIDVNNPASQYLEELKGTNKEYMTIKNVLLHQAGLTPFLLHWRKTGNAKDALGEPYYSTKKTELYNRQVADSVFTTAALEDSIWQWTIDSDLRKPINPPVKSAKSKKKRKKKKKGGEESKPRMDTLRYTYKYSDLTFYVMKAMVERITGKRLNEYMQEEFYTPMGLNNLLFNPLTSFAKKDIAPTEKDVLFRKKQIQGTVHDPGSAMLGGVAGHAGVFSNAFDLAQLMQMNMQGGYFDGKNYFNSDTVVPYFAGKQVEDNRRGLGWDKPFEENRLHGNTSPRASAQTYGHTGFTGTAVWVDPKYNLIFVFLANRVYPDMNHTKLGSENIRPKLHDVVYRSLGIEIVPDSN